MLNVLRKQAQSTLIQGLVLIIAVVFIFWGVGANMNNNRNSVATVNGREITFHDYQRAYDQAVDNMQRQFGGQVPPGLLEGMQLKKQVAGQLIQAELLRQGGEQMGIRVSDLAVQLEVEKIPAFQADGHFDLERYKAILRRNRMTPTGYETGLKADLQRQRVIDAVGGFALVPESKLRNWFAFAGEEIQLVSLDVQPADFESKVVVKDDDLAVWFDKNKDRYKSDPQVRLNYLFFGFSENGKDITISDDELRQRYENEKDSFQQPEQRHARHILFKVAASDSDARRAEQKKKAETVLASTRKGEDFSVLASKFSEGPTKDRGGDLGFFTKGQMVPAFDKAVFSLQAGQISDLVETPFGFHIIKLEAVRPAKIRSFDQVKDSLAATISKEKARRASFKRASKAYEDIMRSGSLDKYGQSGTEKVIVTDYFTQTSPPADLVQDPKFIQEAFSLKKGELSSLVELDTGYAIIFVDDIKEPDLPELASVRQRAVADFTKEKAVDLASKAADELLAQAREKGSLRDVADKAKLVESPPVKRSAVASVKTIPVQVVQDGFKLSWKEKLPDRVVKVGSDFYLYEVIDRRPGSEETDSDSRDKVSRQLRNSTRNVLVSTWLSRVQEQSKIWTNETLLK